MGVVNVTPDSFSDGGRFLETGAAVEQGLKLLAEGADVLDIGGESTRPGSDPTSPADELKRVLPVIQGVLAGAPRAVISIDTYRTQVASEAIKAGAQVINDVTALRGDPAMADLAASSGVGLVLMHMRGQPKTMQVNPEYDDVVGEVGAMLAAQAQAAQAAGVARERIVIDPGIGFGKNLQHNLTLLHNLSQLRAVGYPVLLGASRKAMLGMLTGGKGSDQRLWSTIGVHVAGAMLGADMVRVHDVEPVRDAVLVADAVLRGEKA
ncbi:dihydropteroate synthase [Desulfocarbo indianensis]|nr:dihydropteroate synthase [Desulfocarbo indianensis]